MQMLSNISTVKIWFYFNWTNAINDESTLCDIYEISAKCEPIKYTYQISIKTSKHIKKKISS